jgi:hypothetical protein
MTDKGFLARLEKEIWCDEMDYLGATLLVYFPIFEIKIYWIGIC